MKKKDKQNSFELEYRYDISSDILGVRVKRNFIYNETVEMAEGILLDFGIDNVPVSLEIHDASERFNVPKYSLQHPVFFNMDINVDEKSICLNANIILLIHNKENEQFIKEFTSNQNNLPNMEIELCAT